uniref:Uncharacterized protein n=1 Tax=Anopheles culicifacies TaxID=139723 RepID=A0A182M866_9DIPT
MARAIVWETGAQKLYSAAKFLHYTVRWPKRRSPNGQDGGLNPIRAVPPYAGLTIQYQIFDEAGVLGARKSDAAGDKRWLSCTPSSGNGCRHLLTSNGSVGDEDQQQV